MVPDLSEFFRCFQQPSGLPWRGIDPVRRMGMSASSGERVGRTRADIDRQISKSAAFRHAGCSKRCRIRQPASGHCRSAAYSAALRVPCCTAVTAASFTPPWLGQLFGVVDLRLPVQLFAHALRGIGTNEVADGRIRDPCR
jgi:hypothetical protein